MKNNVINIQKRTLKELEDLPEDLMTITNFAKKYGTSKSYIYKLIYKGAIKHYKYGYSKISESETNRVIRKISKVSWLWQE